MTNFIPLNVGILDFLKIPVKFNLTWYPIISLGYSVQIRSKMKCLKSQKFSLPCCGICFPDSEYITFIKMHLVLRELEPVKVWLKYMDQKWTIGKVGFFYVIL